MSAALDALRALQTQLATITEDNGYACTVGGVFLGRDALAVGTKITLPALTLTSIRDTPETSVDAGVWHQAWIRTVVLEMLADGGPDWETALDTLVQEVRRALTRYSRPLVLGTLTFSPPLDGGAIAVAALELTYRYQTDFSV